MQNAPPTPKGFRDINPQIANKRREVINKISDILERHGFVPIETPTIEFASILTGKYGEEERLIYQFKDRGGRDLALRYDLTVPLARYIAANPSLKMPFSRYQIGQVFRGENPQKGRYREFTQLDFDTVGSAEVEEDVKIIKAALESLKKLGLTSAVMLINDRANFENIPIEVVRAIDKLHKIGEVRVKKELAENLKGEEAEKYLDSIKKMRPTKNITGIIANFKSREVVFDPTLARGLDYYTGAIFELKPNSDPKSLSIGSGGRYDNLIGKFAGKDIPATGFSFGLDRLVDLL